MKLKLKFRIVCIVFLMSYFSLLNAHAQTDSIYGLQVSIINDTLKASFYSTYNSENFAEMNIYVTNPITNINYVVYTATKSNNTVLNSSKGDYTYVPQGNGIYKFTVKVELDPAARNKELKIIFHTKGNNYKSNGLVFFLNP